MADVYFRPGHGLDALPHTREVEQYVEELGLQVRDDARTNARVVTSSSRLNAIISEVEHDSNGYEARIGYDKNHRGFVLWWHEVGTVLHPASPHLRPALVRARP